MDDTTKYVLFGLAILFVIMIPGIIRFCCIERCHRNQNQTKTRYHVQEQYLDQYQYHDQEQAKPIYTQA